MKCEACGRQCRKVTVDFGIGAYEYWGAPGVDVRLADVSDCCEADCIDEDDRPDCMLPDCDRVVEYPQFTDLCSEHEAANIEAGLASVGCPSSGHPQPTKEAGETS